MRRRIIVFCTFAVLAAALFLRLGFWQIARLRERQAFNAMVIANKLATVAPLMTLSRDTAAVHYRGASVAGHFDYAHELVLSPRTRQGSPGVDLITPVRIDGSDTAILVNRGWVYSPDASSVDQTRWREADSANVTGFVELYADDTTTSNAANPNVVRHVSERSVKAKLPYPVAPYYLVATSDSANPAHPVRRSLPLLDEGPHRGYAFQWFCFALIAIGGAGIVVYRERNA